MGVNLLPQDTKKNTKMTKLENEHTLRKYLFKTTTNVLKNLKKKVQFFFSFLRFKYFSISAFYAYIEYAISFDF